jgi:capsular polysaccharide biosynthesis protein
MARHRTGLRRVLDLKPKAHAAFSLLTRGSPGMARRLDFFPDHGPPGGLVLLHDDQVTNPIVAPRYAAELAKVSEHSRETVHAGPGIPPFPQLRRVVWQMGETYFPGSIIAPVDLAAGRIASLTRTGPTNWSGTRPRPFRRAPARIAGRAIAIPYMRHYGHLLTDILAPLAFAVARGVISREDPVTVVCADGDNPVSTAFAEGLVKLGHARAIHRLGAQDGAIADAYLHAEVLCSSGEHRYAMPEVTDLLREIFRLGGNHPDAIAPPPSRVFLTRGDAKLRKVDGEAELIEALRARGFTIFESRWSNHAEQIAVFSGCDLVVGVHGAGLANVIFGKPAARLVEIQAGNARKTTGLFWAACAGMDYTCLLGGPEGQRQSFAIDPGTILSAIDGMAT